MATSYLRMQVFSLYVNGTQGGRGGGRGDGEGWGPTPSVRYSNNTAARSLQDSAASSAKKIRLLEKKLGCNSAKLSLKGN
jgi:hypothetical protein